MTYTPIAEKTASYVLASNEFDLHPFYFETIPARILRPYETSEPDTIRIGVYPKQ